jgi:hypothetical protein
LLNVGGGLGNVLERVAPELKLILLVLRWLDLDTWLHNDLSDNLLANEVSVFQSAMLPIAKLSRSTLPVEPFRVWHVPDLDLVKASLLVLIDVDIDWEMGVDVSHLVLESLGDTDDQVVDESADCSEGSNILARAVVKLDGDDVFLRVLEINSQMRKVLLQCASWTSHFDLATLDGDLDCMQQISDFCSSRFRPLKLGLDSAYLLPAPPESHCCECNASWTVDLSLECRCR